MNPALYPSILLMPILSASAATPTGQPTDPTDVTALLDSRKREEVHRGWGLLRKMGQKGYPIAFARMTKGQDLERVRWLFCKAGLEGYPYLESKLDPRKRRQATMALSILASNRTLSTAALDRIHGLMFHSRDEIRVASLACLQRVDDPRVASWLLTYLEASGHLARQFPRIRDLLIRHGDPKSMCKALTKMADRHAKGVMNLAVMLGRLKSQKTLNAYETLILALAGMGPRGLAGIQELVSSKNPSVRRAGALALAHAGPEAIPLLVGLDRKALTAATTTAKIPSNLPVSQISPTWMAWLYAIEKQGRAPAWVIPKMRRDMDSVEGPLAAASLAAYRSLCAGVSLGLSKVRGKAPDNLVDCVALLGRHSELAMAQLRIIRPNTERIREALQQAESRLLIRLDDPETRSWHEIFIQSQIMH